MLTPKVIKMGMSRYIIANFQVFIHFASRGSNAQHFIFVLTQTLKGIDGGENKSMDKIFFIKLPGEKALP